MALIHQADDQSLSQEEVAAIIRRAGELQQESGAAATGSSGALTLAEVRRSAEELGLSPELIEQAALEIRTRGVPQRRSIWGGPARTDLSSTVDAAVSVRDHADLVEILRDASGRLGEVTATGDALEWTSSSPDTLHVGIRPVAEGVRVRVKAWYGEWAAAYYALAFIVCLLLSVGLPASFRWPFEVGGPVALAIFTAGFACAREGFNGLCRRRRRAAENLFLAVKQHLASRSGTARTDQAEPSE